MTQDPIGLKGSINLYSYPLDPIQQVDPRGLSVWVWALPTAGGLAAADGPLPFGDAAALILLAGVGIYSLTQSGSSTQTKTESVAKCEEKVCPPCKTTTGRFVPTGTIGYRPLEIIPDDKIEHGVYGSHHNIFIANQAPLNSPKPCNCFWAKQKYVLKPEQLTSGMVPVEEFVN